MAYRVGARVIDLEYVQFHPNRVLAERGAGVPAHRGAARRGGVLVNARGERFLDGVHPQGSLAPPRCGGRAIQQEMAASGDACVFLDLSALKADFIRERFPNLYERCLRYGVDMTKEWVPVVPRRILRAGACMPISRDGPMSAI